MSAPGGPPAGEIVRDSCPAAGGVAGDAGPAPGATWGPPGGVSVGAVAGFVEGRTLGVASAGLGVETAPAAAERRTAVPAGLVEGATGEPVAEQRDSAMTTSRVAAPGEVGSSSRCIARTTMPDPPGASSGSCSLSTIWATAGTSTTVLGGAGVTGTAVPPSLSAPRCTDPELATGFASQVLERSAATRMPATERPCTSARCSPAALRPRSSRRPRRRAGPPPVPPTRRSRRW